MSELNTKEKLVLDMLIQRGESYGLDMVKVSGGTLKRGTIYVTLGRLMDKGYVTCRTSLWSNRRKYRATGLGERMFRAVSDDGRRN